MTSRTKRWGFRARLAALIASVFISGGVVLLGVQYLLVQQLFAQGISTITTGCFSATQNGNSPTPDDDLGDTCTIGTSDGNIDFTGTNGSTGSFVIEQTNALSDEVLSGLLMWSIVVLAGFAALAVIAAWWLSKRSLGRIARITATTRDITRDELHRRLDLPGPDDEIKELGDTIDGMLDRLDDAFTRQDRFISGASHELRTPLTTTRTLLEIPLTQGRVPDDLEPAVRGALAANERSEQLIAALLTLARVRRQDASNPVIHTADLTAITIGVLTEHEQEITARSLTVTAPLPGPVLVAGDPELVRIAVDNLIANSIRHNRDNGTIHITAGTTGTLAQLVIANDGREFDAAEVARLTEPFHRGEHTRLAGPGTGLGLTLADTIARTIGGRLALSPRPQGGITATLTL